MLVPSPNKSLQRSVNHKVLGRGRRCVGALSSAARPRADRSVARPLNSAVRRHRYDPRSSVRLKYAGSCLVPVIVVATIVACDESGVCVSYFEYTSF